MAQRMDGSDGATRPGDARAADAPPARPAQLRWPRPGRLAGALALGAFALFAGAAAALDRTPEPQAPVRPGHDARSTPNILFIIMDDVGIDQMRVFGYGGLTPPSTPVIDRIANNGVRFHNTWAMPACTTSRAVFFEGRYPLRTNVFGALGPDDLANSMVSPFEMTAPRMLKQRGYASALFGKFHLGLQGNNPYRLAMPTSLGWDYFSGWLDETGDPSSIDTTAGGVAVDGTSYSCGFVPGKADGGADSGACYSADQSCVALSTVGSLPPGRVCRDRGGIFDPGANCRVPPPAKLDFATLSGHYVSPLVINHENGVVEQVPPTDIRARTYRGTVPVDDALAWIKRQPKNKPWMATVSFSSAHTPVQQPPAALIAADAAAATSALNCGNEAQQRVLTNQMIEAMDKEIGRLLTGLGLARPNRRGGISYEPARTDTMIIVLGDNGTLGSAVKKPFDTSRAKGTAYQTGVWVPLVIAGPLVDSPDRVVSHMVNIADLFQLFGEIAGIDVPRAVPRTIDSVALLPYLRNPDQRSLRSYNFTQVAPNLQADGALNGPCQIGSTCTQIPVTKSVCEDNDGVWWGKGATAAVTAGIPKNGLKYCCEVNVWQKAHDAQTYGIEPLSSLAIRNDKYKIVSNYSQINDPTTGACGPQTTWEFYAIDESVPIPTLDTSDADLLAQGKPPLTPEEQANYDALYTRLQALLASQAPCPGDGNIDGVVNGYDLVDWKALATLAQGGSSWYDFNFDGLTNAADLEVVQRNLGVTCPQ